MVDSRKDFFWGPHFHFFGGSGRLFFVGCDVFQKLRIISKIADHAFEMVMTIDLILQRGLFSLRMIRNFCKTQDEPRGWEKTVSEGVKPIESLPRNFCGLVIHIKNTFCKKIGSKRSFQPSAVVRAIYPPSIWGPSRQLDDQHRNTNMNNKDHLVGQLTNTQSNPSQL